MDLKVMNIVITCMVIYIWSQSAVIQTNHTGHHHIADIDIDYNPDEVGYKADGVVYNPYDFGSNAYDADLDRRAYVACICGTSNFLLNHSLELDVAEKIFNEISNSISTNETVSLYPNIIFDEDCKVCEVGLEKCNTKSKNCIRRIVEFEVIPEVEEKIGIHNSGIISKRSIQMLPITIHIPVGGLKNNRRQARQLETCVFPSYMHTAEFSCTLYGSSTKCIQRCVFGYTLENGIALEMQCKHEENKWTPHGFKECEPYIDCNFRMITAAAANCTSPVLDRAPECQIECYSFFGKPGVPERTYICHEDGVWEPRLPFCVLSPTGLALVEAPEVKYHD